MTHNFLSPLFRTTCIFKKAADWKRYQKMYRRSFWSHCWTSHSLTKSYAFTNKLLHQTIRKVSSIYWLMLSDPHPTRKWKLTFPVQISHILTRQTSNWALQKIPQHTIMLFVCHPKILHNHCFQFLLEKLKYKEHYGKVWSNAQGGGKGVGWHWSFKLIHSDNWALQWESSQILDTIKHQQSAPEARARLLFKSSTTICSVWRILHGCIEIGNFSSSVEKYFLSECSERVKYFFNSRRDILFLHEIFYLLYKH